MYIYIYIYIYIYVTAPSSNVEVQTLNSVQHEPGTSERKTYYKYDVRELNTGKYTRAPIQSRNSP